jgi:hypothetical protein
MPAARLVRSRLRLAVAASLVVALGVPAAAATVGASAKPKPKPTSSAAGDDATVVAVIDSGFSPYHYDFLGSKMPQAGTDAALPVDQAPDTYLKGFPSPASFAGYKPLTLSLPGADPKQTQDSLHQKDAAQWATVKGSRPGAIDYRWIPGTKVIGALSFETLDTDRPVDQVAFGSDPTIYGSGGGEHGMGTSSVAVGNVHGACPECLFVFIQYTSMESAERALTWAMQQPWIDAISNSYGFSALIAARDRIYNDTDVATERTASERGQTVFFSAGNGVENAFTVPNSTLLSSQEGPDWVVTVGAVSPNGNDFTGTGKPADIAGIGYGYPSAYDSTTVSDGADFSGTSNATPQVAGTYAKALYAARQALPGASRVQSGGVIATGKKVQCGRARPGCELGDGVLTATELRNRLFLGATPTDGHFEDGVSGLAEVPTTIADTRFASEGHGAYFGAVAENGFALEFRQRLYGVLNGEVRAAPRPDGEVDWFRVDSACRQHIWGEWSGGYYKNETTTPQPESSPDWPTRSLIQTVCPSLQQPPPPVV